MKNKIYKIYKSYNNYKSYIRFVALWATNRSRPVRAALTAAWRHYRRHLRRQRRRYFAYVILTSMVLQLVLPLVGLIQPVQANNLIKPTQKGDSLFENQSPGFKAEFGDKSEPTAHRLRFEAEPSYNGYNSYKDYSAEKPTAFQRAKEAMLGAKSKGVELRLIELGESTQAPVEHSLSSEASSLAPESVVSTGFGRTGDFSNEKSGPSEKALAPIQSQLQEVESGLKEVETGITSVSKDVAEVTKVTKNILEESGVGKPELSVRPSMEETPEDFAKSAGYNNYNDYNSYNGYKEQSVPPLELTAPIDTVSQTIDETTKMEYQIVVGKGVKESITLLDRPQKESSFASEASSLAPAKSDPSGFGRTGDFSNEKSGPSEKESITLMDQIRPGLATQGRAFNEFNFELKLDPGVEVKRAMDGIRDKGQGLKAKGDTLSPSSTIYFVDQFGRYLFHFQAPYMIDAAGAKSSAVELKIAAEDGSDYNSYNGYNNYKDYSQPRKARLTLTADSQWLSAENRVYPILIDPTIVHEDNPAFASGTENRSQTTTTPAVETQYKELQPDINTVGLWHFNEGTSTTAYDASGNANNGTLTNGPVWNGPTDTIVGLGKSSLKFDDANDYVTTADAASLDLTTNGTIEAWVKPNAIEDNNWIVCKASNYCVGLNSTGAVLYTGASAQNDGGTGVITANQWYHIAVTNNNTTATYYVNGVTTGTDAVAWGSTLTNALEFGRDGSTNYFDGTIDEIRISNVVRTPEEIAADASRFPYAVHESPVIDFGSTPNSLDSLNYSATGVQTGDGEKPFSTDGLVAAWNFNETSGTTAYNTAGSDSCGGTPSSCNGTLTSMTTSGQDAAAGDGWTANNRRWGAGALMFDGTDGYVTTAITSPLQMGSNNITLSAWVKTNKSANQAIISSLSTSTPYYELNVLSSNKAFFAVRDASSNEPNITGNINVADGNWHYLVGVLDRDAGLLKLYVDGVLDKTGANTATNTINPTGNLDIGRRNAGGAPVNYFNGTIDSTRIYSRALSAVEVLSNFQSGNIEFQTRTGATSTPNDGTWEAWKSTSGSGDAQLDAVDSLSPVEKISQTGLTAYWKLDETSGSRADSKGANTLTDNNTVTYAPGRLGNAGQFTAANSEYLSITDNADLSTGNIDFSLSAWVYMDTKSAEMKIVSKWQTGVANNSEYLLAYRQVSDRFIFAVDDDGNEANWTTVLANSLGSPSTATWYFIVAWHDATANTINIQVNNGTADSTAFSTGLTDQTAGFLIGAHGAAAPTNFWDGRIDEVGFWKRTLTAAERTRLFEDGLDLHGAGSGRIYRSLDTTTKIEGTASEKLQIGAPQCGTGTVGLYHIEETSNSNGDIKDACNSNNLTPKGTPAVTDGFYGKARITSSTAYICSDVNADGTCDSDADLALTGDLSVEAWVKSTGDTNDWNMVFHEDNTDGSKGLYSLRVNGNANADVVTAIIYTTATTSYLDVTGTTKIVNDNKWHHVAMTLSGTTLTLYVDGVSEGTDTTTSGTRETTTTGLIATIGSRQCCLSSSYFAGQIDEVKLSNTARSAEEIAEAYRAGRDHRLTKTITATDLSAKTKLPFYVASDRPGTFMEATVGESALLNNFAGDPDLKGYWPLDENSTGAAAVTRNDYSGNGNNLTDNATVTSTQGKIGRSADFERSNAEYLSLSDNANVSFADEDFSFAFWVNFEDTSVQQILINKTNTGTTATSAYYLSFGNVVGKFEWLVGNGTTSNQLTDDNIGTISAGTWYWVYVWHDSVNNQIGIQTNNGPANTKAHSAGSFDDSNPFLLGRLYNNGTGGYEVDGRMDEVVMMNRLLTADERRQMFEIGKRTHPITIDFKADLDSSNLITGSGDLSFAINPDINVVNSPLNIAKGEKIIVRENVGGTEYISQGTVSAITYGAGVSNANAPNQALTNATSTVVTVTSWDSGATFPSAGYTVNATVFKWQREFMDLTQVPLSTQRDAITRLTMRVTDGSAGATVWLDDFNSADYSGGAMTGSNSASITIGSTAQRYFQYRTILSVIPAQAGIQSGSPIGSGMTSPALTSVLVNYNSGTTPQPPRTKDASSDFSATGTSLDRVTDTGSSNSPSLELAYKELPKDINTVGLWHMNENAANTCTGGVNDVCDASGNTNDGAFNGNATHTTSSKLGASATTYDGSGDYTDAGSGSSISFTTQDFTIEFWFKMSTTGTVYLLSKYKTTDNGGYIVYTSATGQIQFFLEDTSVANYFQRITTNEYDDGNWHHFAGIAQRIGGTYNSNGVKIYIDGKEEVGTTGSAGTVSNVTCAATCNLTFGASSSQANYFNGQIDDVRISNIARTPEEIKLDAQHRPYGVYTSDVQNLGTNVSSIDNLRWTENGVQTGDGETPYSTNGLVAQWNFNETSGTTASNAATASCGSACNGTLTTFASTSSQDQAAGTGWTKDNRKWGAGALMFDGTNDYVTVGDVGIAEQASFTFSSWVKTTAAAQQIIYMDADSTSDVIYFRPHMRTTGVVSFDLRTAAGEQEFYSNTKINDGNFHMVTMVRSSSNGYIYIDGKLDNSGTFSITPATNISTIGAHRSSTYPSGTQFWNGVIDAVSVYSRALTASEILANYQAGNVELQTRTGTTTTPNDGTWEEWRPSGNSTEVQLDNLQTLSPVQKINTSNLVGYWKLDEVSGNRSDSAGSNTLTDNATVTSKAGHLNLAGQFTTANSEYLTHADSSDFDTGDIDFTFSTWVYIDSLPTSGNAYNILSKYGGATSEYLLRVNNSSGTIRFVWYPGETAALNADTFGTPVVGTWYFITSWYDSVAKKAYISINNGAADSASITNTASSTGTFCVGCRYSGGTPIQFWDGRIDEVGFWKRVLTADERRILYEDGLDKTNDSVVGGINRTIDTTTKIEGTGSEKLTIGAPQVDSSTVALWHMDETSGSGAYIQDATANNNDGTPTGTTVVDGFYGKGRSFNGTSDYILTSAPIVSAGTKSVEFWMKTTSTVDDYLIDNCGGASANHGIIIEVNSTANKLRVFACKGTPGTPNYTITSNAVVNDGKWHHVGFTWDGTTSANKAILYIDGVQDNTATAATASESTPTYNLNIGRDAANQSVNYDGSIDEVRVSNTARSAEEIAEAYRAGRDHRLSKTITATDLSAKTKLPFYVAADRPGTFLEATVGESALLNNFAGDPDLKGYWPLDENSTGAAAVTRNDYSGNGNNLTDNATVTSTQGKIGKAGQFTAANSEYLSIADNASLSTGDIDFSVATWVYADSFAENKYVVSKVGGTDDHRLIFYKNASSKFAFSPDGETTIVTADALGTPSTGTWYFIVVSHDSTANQIGISVNNGPVTTTSFSGGLTDSTGTFRLGTYNGTGNYWNGKIDEVMMIKRVLTADERRQMFEIGKRTHQITNDFVTTPQAAYSSGTSVTINNPSGTTNLTDTLSIGDTMIFKENVGGTETVSQAVVTAITNTSSVYGTVTLLAAPTFPSGGFTTNATVFKWQREFFDVTNSLTSQRDATSRITLRVTDGSQGANVWIDDIKAAGPYLSVGSARTSTIASTPQQYFQYRVIFTTTDTAVSPTVTAISVQYHSDPQKVTGADTFLGTSVASGGGGTVGGTYDNDGNVQLGSNNVKDVQFYDRTKDQISYALETDGSNDYVDIGTPSSIDFTWNSTFTLEAWIKTTQASGTQQIVIGRDKSGTAARWNLMINNTKVRLNLVGAWSTNLIAVDSSNAINDGYWHHISATYNGNHAASGAKIYIDGVDTTTVVTDALTSDFVITAGNLQMGNLTGWSAYAGLMDEVTIFNTVRTAAQVQADYNARRLADTTTGLVGLWHFDEGSGTRAYDSSGNANHGTLTNMTDDDWVNSLSDKDQSALSQQVLGVDPNWGNGVGRESYAMNFDGTGDYLSVADNNNFTPSSGFTAELWFKDNGTTGPGNSWVSFLEKYTASNREWYLATDKTTNTYRLAIYDESANAYISRETTSVTTTFDGNWHHLAGVWSGGTTASSIKLFYDGVQVDTTDGSSGTFVNVDNLAAPVQIGYNSDFSTVYLKGFVDEARVSNSARYSSNFAPPKRLKEDANTMLLLHMDEGADNLCSGGTNDACDASSTGGDMVINGNPTWVTDARAVMDNNARYLSLGASSAVNTDRGMEIKITSTTAFQYRWQGDQTWTTPATSTLSSYTFASPAQIDSTGVYVGFDTTNGTFGDESYFLIPSWALEQFSNSDTQNAMRGTKRGFPERTYLVATDKGVDILDADTNNLWMRVENGSGRSLGTFTNNTPSSVFMSHGQLFVGTNGTAATGLYRYDFNRDKIYRYNATNRTTNTVNIAKRNTADSSYGSADTAQNLISSVVNDAHALTIQGKLIMAAATDTGVTKISNIMSSDTSYDYSDNASDDYGHVVLAETAGGAGDVYTDNDTTDALERWNNVLDDAASETAGIPDTTYDETSTPALFVTAATEINDLKLTNQTSTVEAASPTIYIGHDLGATVLNEKRSDPTNGSVKYLTKDYVSEELIGDTNGFWPLNETSGTRTDQSVKTNDLTDNNTVTSASGVRGTAAQFTAANSEYLSIADNASLSTGDIDFTIAGWAYLDSKTVTDKTIVGKASGGSAATTEYQLMYRCCSTDRFMWRVSNGSAFTSVNADNLGVPSTSTWYYVVAWHDSVNNEMGIQVNNGTANTAAYTGGLLDTAFTYAIGAAGNSGGDFFDGRIDEVLFTKEVLSAAQRTQLYVSGKEALNNKYRVKLASDTLNQLNGSTNVTKAIGKGGEYLYIGTNGSSADDGSLSRILVNDDTRDREYDESTKEPYLLTDNDINNLSVSGDGAYIVVGTDDQGITIIQNGSNAVRLRGGSKVQGPYKRPHN